MKPFRTRLINVLTAAAVSLAAVTSGTAPVAAKEEDMLKVIAGIAAVAAFAGVLNQQQNQGIVSRTPPLPLQPTQHGWPDQNPRWQADRWQGDGRQGYPWPDEGWRLDPPADRRGPRLPGVCALKFGNASRPAVYYSESCLRREGAAFGLPQYCAQQIRTRDYQGRVFEAECLRDAGYRTERRR